MRPAAESICSFVLDNSVLCGWFLANQADAYTESIAALLLESEAAAPPLLQLEFVNVLRTGCRRGGIPIQKAREIIDQVAALPIRIDAAPLSPTTLLALRLQLPIATRDSSLAEAAWAAGVGVVKS